MVDAGRRALNAPVRILVVEDFGQHQLDFQQMFEVEAPRFPFDIEVVYATTYAEATYLVEQVDGVLSDVFCPIDVDGSIVPCGMYLAMQCISIGKPVMLCINTDYRSQAMLPVHSWGTTYQLQVFDVPYEAWGDPNNHEGQAERKPWHEAFMALMIFVIGMRAGTHKIENGEFEGDYVLTTHEILDGEPPLGELAQRFIDEFGFPTNPRYAKA